MILSDRPLIHPQESRNARHNPPLKTHPPLAKPPRIRINHSVRSTLECQPTFTYGVHISESCSYCLIHRSLWTGIRRAEDKPICTSDIISFRVISTKGPIGYIRVETDFALQLLSKWRNGYFARRNHSLTYVTFWEEITIDQPIEPILHHQLKLSTWRKNNS